MKKMVKYINVELLVHSCDDVSSTEVAKEYNGFLDNYDIVFSEAVNDLVDLEQMGINSSLRCFTYSIEEDVKE